MQQVDQLMAEDHAQLLVGIFPLGKHQTGRAAKEPNGNGRVRGRGAVDPQLPTEAGSGLAKLPPDGEKFRTGRLGSLVRPAQQRAPKPNMREKLPAQNTQKASSPHGDDDPEREARDLKHEPRLKKDVIFERRLPICKIHDR